MRSFKPIDTYSDKAIAKQELSSLLKSGSLCLFLGAGVSQSSFEFPGWIELVKNCCNKVKINTSDIQSDDVPIDILLKKMEQVRDHFANAEKYKKLVRKQLVSKFQLDYHHAKNILLISIGALVISSQRGSIEEIVTYNFDDLLEWYLDLHGYKVQVVNNLPFLYEDADVRIFHPHGFLPKQEKYEKARHFIFDLYEYDLNVGDVNSPWFSMCKQLLLQKIAIMIGLSGDDPALRSLVVKTYEELKSTNTTRPVAFLLNRNKSLESSFSTYYKRGIVPIGFDTYDEIWKFVLEICQMATLL